MVDAALDEGGGADVGAVEEGAGDLLDDLLAEDFGVGEGGGGGDDGDGAGAGGDELILFYVDGGEIESDVGGE